MKLFLASSFADTAHRLAEVAPEVGKKVVFVANAAEPWGNANEMFWVKNDHDAFTKLGYQVTEVDLHKTSKEEFAKHLADADILHICGGGVFYINELLKDTGLAPLVTEAVRSGSVVYTGTSAGSIIVSNTFACYEPESEEVAMVKRPGDKVGLGLINFVVAPHNNNPDSAAAHAEMIPRQVNNPEALFFIRDDQAVWVDDGGAKLVIA